MQSKNIEIFRINSEFKFTLGIIFFTVVAVMQTFNYKEVKDLDLSGFFVIMLMLFILGIIFCFSQLKEKVIIDFSTNEIIVNEDLKIKISSIREIQVYGYNGKHRSYSVSIFTNKNHKIEFYSKSSKENFIDTLIRLTGMKTIKNESEYGLFGSTTNELYRKTKK